MYHTGCEVDKDAAFLITQPVRLNLPLCTIIGSYPIATEAAWNMHTCSFYRYDGSHTFCGRCDNLLRFVSLSCSFRLWSLPLGGLESQDQLLENPEAALDEFRFHCFRAIFRSMP